MTATEPAEARDYSFDQFFHLSQDLCCIAGFDGYFKCLNPAWARTLETTIDELTSRPFMEWVHPDDREQTRHQAEGLARGEDVVLFENRYRRSDGSYRRLLWSCRSNIGEQLIYGTARDVTEQREALMGMDALNARLRRQSEEVEATNRELAAFSYSVSHDLRAPLRAIDGFSLAIQESDGDTLSADAQDSLRRVRKAARRMGMLIDDLLALSRLTRMDMRREPVDLSAMAASIVIDLRRQFPERDVDVSIGTGLMVNADARMLRVALQNLIENAWKYTSHLVQARIEISGHADAGEPSYSVRDNGAGFDMRYAGKLFGAFERLHTDHQFEGTGIGLATVQRIVQRHGGRIWADSAPGVGATFTFTLGAASVADTIP